MFQSPCYLEKVDYERVNQDTPLTLLGNSQHQTKTRLNFFVKD